jgi:hypothetical protein
MIFTIWSGDVAALKTLISTLSVCSADTCAPRR